MEWIEIDVPKEVITNLYAPIGSVVLHWSLLEQSIEHWVNLIYNLPSGSDVKRWKKKMPFLLTAKIKFLENRFSEMNVLRSVSAKAFKLLGEIDEISETRDILVHGALSKYQPSSDQFVFSRLSLVEGYSGHVISRSVLTIQEILGAGAKMANLSGQTMQLTEKLLTLALDDKK